MGIAALLTSEHIAAGPKPRDEDLDLFGLTHQGLVRKDNQDQFLLGTIHQQVLIHGTSLPHTEDLPLRSQRLATILLVADGVGGGADGADASQIAADRVARYVTSAMDCYHNKGRGAEKEFFEALEAAALAAHDAVRAESAARTSAEPRPIPKNMATTLTVGLAVWPWLYLLQVGDSRAYLFIDGKLRQVTRDQTLAQDLVDKGALPASKAAASPFSHVLASAIGGREARPAVSKIGLKTGCMVVMCSDGLTKHVTDDEIEQQCKQIVSAEQMCRNMLDMVLERGGSDNTTIIVARGKIR